MTTQVSDTDKGNAAPASRRTSAIGRIMIFLGLLALLLLAGGALFAIRSVSLVLREPAADGTVISITSTVLAHETRYTPTFQFNVSGESYSVQGPGATGPNVYHVGQAVQVRYDPANPKQAQIAGFRELWLAPIALIVMGLALGYVATRFTWNRPQRG